MHSAGLRSFRSHAREAGYNRRDEHRERDCVRTSSCAHASRDRRGVVHVGSGGALLVFDRPHGSKGFGELGPLHYAAFAAFFLANGVRAFLMFRGLRLAQGNASAEQRREADDAKPIASHRGGMRIGNDINASWAFGKLIVKRGFAEVSARQGAGDHVADARSGRCREHVAQRAGRERVRWASREHRRRERSRSARNVASA